MTVAPKGPSNSANQPQDDSQSEDIMSICLHSRRSPRWLCSDPRRGLIQAICRLLAKQCGAYYNDEAIITRTDRSVDGTRDRGFHRASSQVKGPHIYHWIGLFMQVKGGKNPVSPEHTSLVTRISG
ncbi:hypothetical protein RRG08_010793 [Elysia crispata]|uniref:Uncharacterized protein n=1 Tax=Elysia crispata TaxID=231223 RepID=A0AAE1AN56_9GAST|nr:hypothetical protein RRG08_010793 [Elysia crispata]